MLLNRTVEIIVPSTVGTDAAPQELIDYHIENALDALARVAGGSTAVAGEGAWLDDRGHLVRERVCKVYAHCSEAQLVWAVEAAKRVAADIKQAMCQASVAIVVNGTMYFVEDDDYDDDDDDDNDALSGDELECLEHYYAKWLDRK